MTATLRRRPSSTAAPPLEDDDLLSEILLRLPPLPSSLPRAAAISRRWRSLASDPRFSGRFRAHHRRSPPLLGCFVRDAENLRFQPALEPPNRVPHARFSFPIDAGDSFRILGCRHGLMLIFHATRNQLLVWDPVTGDQHRLDIPPGFDTLKLPINGAVLRAVGDVHHFQVVLVGNVDMQHTQLVGSIYSSEIGAWGNRITAPLSGMQTWVYPGMPAVMVGDSLYWLVCRKSLGILEFDLHRRSLALIPMPRKTPTGGMGIWDMWIIKAEGGGLGFLLLSKFNAQLWKRKTNGDGVDSWVLGRSIQLDKLLSLNPETLNPEAERKHPLILGFAEDNNVVLLLTSIGIFTVQFESLQFKKIMELDGWGYIYPFECVYTADKGISGGHDQAELLKNT